MAFVQRIFLRVLSSLVEDSLLLVVVEVVEHLVRAAGFLHMSNYVSRRGESTSACRRLVTVGARVYRFEYSALAMKF